MADQVAGQVQPGLPLVCIGLRSLHQVLRPVALAQGLVEILAVAAVGVLPQPVVRRHHVVDGLQQGRVQGIIREPLGGDQLEDGGCDVHVAADGVAGKAELVQLPVVHEQHRAVPFPQVAVPVHQGRFAEHRAHVDGMVPGQDEQAVRVGLLHGADEFPQGLVREPEGSQVLLDFLIPPDIPGSVGHHLLRIISILCQGDLEGSMVTGGIQEVELVGAVGFLLLLDQFRCFFQEHIVVHPHPCFRCMGAAEIRGRHHLVEAAGRSELVEVPVGYISPVPVGGMVAQLLQLPGQCRGQVVFPEALLFVQLQASVEDAAHEADNGRPGNDARRQGAGHPGRMGILHQLPSARYQVQTGKLGIEELLQVRFPHKQEDMGGFSDPRPPGRPFEPVSRVGQPVHRDLFRQEGLDGFQVLPIRMLIGWIQLVLQHLFQCHQIVHRSLGKENVLFHHAGDGIPFRLVVMPEGAPIPEPVERRNAPQEDHGVVAVVEDGVEEIQVLEAGQPQKGLDAPGAHPQVGQDAQQDEGPMVLVEENVHQVVFLRFGPQFHGLVEDVVEVLVKQHLPRKGQVQHQTVHQATRQPQGVAPLVPHREERSGQGQENQRDQEHIGIEIHAPPEPVPETVPDHRPLPLQAPVGIVHFDENETEHSTQDGEEQEQLRILLHGFIEYLKQSRTSFMRLPFRIILF